MTSLRVLIVAPGLLLAGALSASAQIRMPVDGFDWHPGPSQSRVGDCFGNCGAGCSDSWNPCGGRSQYWQLTITSEPQLIDGNGWWEVQCFGESEYLIHYTVWQASGRWTYVGHAAAGCLVHDSTCPEATFFGCLWWAGCGTEWDQEWGYDQLMTGYRRSEVEPTGGSCPGPLP